MRTTTILAALLMAAGAAQAGTQQFAGTFHADGGVGASGSGSLLLTYDNTDHTLLIDLSFSGLSSATTRAHIHCCTATANTGTAPVALATGGNLPDFPTGVTSGNYMKVIDLTQASSFNGPFVTANGDVAGAESMLIAKLGSQQAYLNIHTASFPGGEMRAFVTAVPEPASWALMALGLGAVGGMARRRA